MGNDLKTNCGLKIQISIDQKIVVNFEFIRCSGMETSKQMN